MVDQGRQTKWKRRQHFELTAFVVGESDGQKGGSSICMRIVLDDILARSIRVIAMDLRTVADLEVQDERLQEIEDLDSNLVGKVWRQDFEIVVVRFHSGIGK